MLFEIVFWAGLALCLSLSYLIFRDIADISQFWLKSKRKVVMRTWHRRHMYLFLSVLAGAAAIYTHEVLGAGNMAVLWIVIVACLVQLLGGYFNPGWMMRTMQRTADFVPIDKARKFVQDDYEVIVIEKKGVARAHTDYELWRPHVVGTPDGLNGENIVLTYCAMTNLPVAFEPEIDGKPLDLRVMTQLENNLVMWDRNSGEPIQQLWGTRECDGPAGPPMRQYPCFKMPFGKFTKAYPEGRVFSRKRATMVRNPALAIYDKFWEALFYMAIHRQKQEDAPIFPTLRNFDDRLPTKQNVWGFNVGNDYVCYTIPFVKEQGNLLNVLVGDRNIVVHWDEEYESLGIWYNDSDTAVSSMNFFGQSNVGNHERVENVKAGCFYGMWFNFFPQTDVNRLPLLSTVLAVEPAA